jgi:hypothetical protein
MCQYLPMAEKKKKKKMKKSFLLWNFDRMGKSIFRQNEQLCSGGNKNLIRKHIKQMGEKNWVELIGFLSTSRHSLFRIGKGAYISAIS